MTKRRPWPGEPQRLVDLDVSLPRFKNLKPQPPSNNDEARGWKDKDKLRTRRTREARLENSDLEMLREVCRAKWFGEFVGWVASFAPQPGPGRPPTTNPASTAVMIAFTEWLDNERDAHRQLGHHSSWKWLRKALKRDWPDRPDLRLPTRRPSREAHRRAVAHLPEGELAERLEAMAESHAYEVAEIIFETNPNPYSNPTHGNVLSGDATFVRSRTNHPPGSKGTRHDGTTYPHLVDPLSRGMGKRKRPIPTDRYKAPTDSTAREPRATPHTFVSARILEGNERVIFNVAPVPLGTSDATVFTDYLVANRDRLKQFTVANYDMALRGANNQRLVEAGYIPVVKVTRTKGGGYDSAIIGIKTFNTRRGVTHQQAVFTIDGHAGVVAVAAGEEWWIPLKRVQVRPRNTTIYVDMRVPDHATVPEHLVGASVRLRANDTIKERDAGYAVAEHFRVYPEGDPVFNDLYGLREDTESHNNKYKNQLERRRTRTANPWRNRADLALWMLFENTRAHLAHDARIARAAGPPLARVA